MGTLNVELANRLAELVSKIREGSYGENDVDTNAIVDDFQDIVDDIDSKTEGVDPQH